MGLGQSSKAPVTDHTDEGEWWSIPNVLSFLSFSTSWKRSKRNEVVSRTHETSRLFSAVNFFFYLLQLDPVTVKGQTDVKLIRFAIRPLSHRKECEDVHWTLLDIHSLRRWFTCIIIPNRALVIRTASEGVISVIGELMFPFCVAWVDNTMWMYWSESVPEMNSTLAAPQGPEISQRYMSQWWSQRVSAPSVSDVLLSVIFMK